MKNNSIYNRNTKGRTSLYEDPRRSTVRFKVVFPNFDEWKANLKFYGISETNIKEDDYNFLNGMIGNAFLKFKTDVKNKAAVAFRFKEYFGIREREQQLYDLSQEKFISQNSTNINTFMISDRSEDGQLVETDYVANKTRQELTATLPYAQQLNELNKFNAMVAPQLLFLSRLADSIVYPLHTDERTL